MQARPLLSVEFERTPDSHALKPGSLSSARRVLIGCVFFVLLLHATLLTGWLFGASGTPAPLVPPTRLIQFREVVLPAPAPLLSAPQSAAPTAAAPARAVAPVSQPQPSVLNAKGPEPTEINVPEETPASDSVAAREPEEVPVAQAASEPSPTTQVESEKVGTGESSATVQAWPGVESDAPLYRVALPPGFKQRYVLRAGPFSGTGELSWAPAGGRYELSLSGGARVYSVTQSSQGRFDVTGLEPERFTSKVSGRAELAANFQRDTGIISFSGVNRRFAWRMGAQDRLSVVIQLVGIVAAESNRLVAGQRFGIPVVSERGDADIWTFRIVGWEPVHAASGEVTALRMVRELRKPNDRGLEIWMDQQRHYLPLRIRYGSENDSKRVELQIE